MELQFKSIDHKIDSILTTLKDQNTQTEKQFLRLDNEISLLKGEVQELREANARYKTVWGIGATVGASVVGLISSFLFNKIF